MTRKNGSEVYIHSIELECDCCAGELLYISSERINHLFIMKTRCINCNVYFKHILEIEE